MTITINTKNLSTPLTIHQIEMLKKKAADKKEKESLLKDLKKWREAGYNMRFSDKYTLEHLREVHKCLRETI